MMATDLQEKTDSDDLYNDPVRSPDMILTVPGQRFTGQRVNPVCGPRVPIDAYGAITTNASQDTTVPFRTRSGHVLVQNNTAATIFVDFDVPASQGSFAIAANQSIFFDIGIDELHLWTAAAVSVNGTATGGIVVRAWQ